MEDIQSAASVGFDFNFDQLLEHSGSMSSSSGSNGRGCSFCRCRDHNKKKGYKASNEKHIVTEYDYGYNV